MNKWITFLLLIVLWPFYAMGTQQLVDNENLNNSKINPSAKTKIYGVDSSYYTVLPMIHQGMWPDFCAYHLQNDPEGCSAWGEEKKGPVDLELLLYGHSHAHIDRELFAKLDSLIHLIPISNKRGQCKQRCDYVWCPTCKQTVIRGVCCRENDTEYDDETDSHLYNYQVVYRCNCTEGYWLSLRCLFNEEDDIFLNWKFCNAPTIYSGYFDLNNKIYFRHLKIFLAYLKENPSCNCYWPQVDEQAKEISNSVYVELNKIIEPLFLDRIYEYFVPHWFSGDIANKSTIPTASYAYPYKDRIGRTPHEILSELLTHAFFYTHYRDVFLDFDQFTFKELPSFDYPLTHQQLIDIEEAIQKPFLQLYNQCLQKHPHPKIYYERGMVLFHRGDNLDALEDIRMFISYAENHHYQELLSSDLYLKEGRLLSESLSYDEAIVSLTKAIEKDPKNKEAYFERAVAYFEAGDFSKALSDYLASGIHPNKVDPQKVGNFNYTTFGQGIALGMLNGGVDSAVEFVPSLLSSFRGISKGLWAFVSSPIAVSQDMIECANACLEFIKDNATIEILGKLVPELQECLQKWNQIDDYTKGKYIGYIIGKYGIDIFIGSGSIKAMQLYRNLRRANTLMTFETAAVSPKLAQEVLEQCIREEKIRYELLKSGRLKIEWDKQTKHIPGKHNYQPGKSIFEHPDPQKLLEEFAGSGQKINGITPGKPGYKEAVDFQEYIGIWKNESGTALPTTRGAIHYSKKGAHIVPLEPKA